MARGSTLIRAVFVMGLSTAALQPSYADEAASGDLKVGGAIRFNYHQNDYGDAYNGAGKLDFDTARINIDYEKNAFTASFEYRFYKSRAASDGRFVQNVFDGASSDSHFLHHAWLGWQLGNDSELRAGLDKVPFGILPFASNSYFFQLPYYVGLEDAHNLGVRYATRLGSWTAHVGFYARPAPNGHGDSEDSARYTYNVVETENAKNRERNTLVGRIARTVRHGENASTEIGLSLLAGQVPDDITDDTGSRWAAALHAKGTYGRWGTKIEFIRYRYRLEGTQDDVVMMGAYDAPYEVAAKGSLLVAGINYTLPVNQGPLEEVTFYYDYSALYKEKTDFPQSRQSLFGAVWKMGKWLVYTDLAFGKHHPFIGPDYGVALGAGGEDEWHRRFNINVGYYF